MAPSAASGRRAAARATVLASHVLDGQSDRRAVDAGPCCIEALITAASRSEEDIDVDDVAYGFMASQALFTALEINIFDHIAASNGPVTIEELGKLVGSSAPRLQTLVTALVSIRALRKADAGYTLSPNSAKLLVKSSKYFYGDYLRMQIGQQFYKHMGALPQIMKTGQGPDYATLFTDASEADTYTRAQHNGSLATASQLCKRVDFSRMASLLDIGGGSGAFAIMICRRNPQIRARILELPEVCNTGESYVQSEPAEVAKRISYVRGSCLDAWPDELGSGHDAVLISYVSESVPADAVPKMYARAFDRLRPGGALVVHSFMVDDSMDGPKLAALWSLQHVAVNVNGIGLTPSTVTSFMAEVGFTEVHHSDMIGGMTKLVIGRKPGK